MFPPGAFFRSTPGSARHGDLIAPDRKSRTPHFPPALARQDVIDAEYEIVAPAGGSQANRPETWADRPSRHPERRHFDRQGFVFAQGADGFSAGAGTRMPTGFICAVATVSIVSFWIFGGHALFSRAMHSETGPTVAGPAAHTKSATSAAREAGNDDTVVVITGSVRKTVDPR